MARTKAKRMQKVPISDRKARKVRHLLARHLGLYSHECRLSFVDNTTDANPRPSDASEYRITVPSAKVQELPSTLQIPSGVKVEMIDNHTYRLTSN